MKKMIIEWEYLIGKIMPHFEGQDMEELSDFFETIEFKHNKSVYHLDNIKEKILKSTNFDQENYYENTYFTLYYELESFLIAIRSAVDIIMHAINKTLKLNIPKNDTNIGTVYRHPGVSVRVTNVLHKYSHNRSNQLWNFIYQARNEIIHEKSVNQTLPVTIDFFQTPEVTAFMEVNNERKNLTNFLEACLTFIQRFIIHLFEALSVSLERGEQNQGYY